MRASIAIVIPIGDDKYLKPLMNSIKLAGDFDQLILVIDDSQENAELFKVIKLYANEASSTICCYTGKKSGASRARNLGLSYVTSDYTLFLDADDMLTPDAINIIRAELIRLHEPDVIYGNLNNVTPEGIFLSQDGVTRSSECKSPNDIWTLYSEGISQLGAMYIKTSYVRKIGAFRESLMTWTDRDLQYRLILGEGRICFIDRILMCWRHGHKGRLSEKAYIDLINAKLVHRGRWPRHLWDPVHPPYKQQIIDHLWRLEIEFELFPEIKILCLNDRFFLCRQNYQVKISEALALLLQNTTIKDLSPLQPKDKEFIFDFLFDDILKIKHPL